MIAIPAIDLRDGACVQLVGGSYDDERVRIADPLAVARDWSSAGFTSLHVVDLDAATGGGSNAALVDQLLRESHRRGAGRRRRALRRALDELLRPGRRARRRRHARDRGARLARPDRAPPPRRDHRAADVRNGKPVTHGWAKSGAADVRDVLRRLNTASTRRGARDRRRRRRTPRRARPRPDRPPPRSRSGSRHRVGRHHDARRSARARRSRRSRGGDRHGALHRHARPRARRGGVQHMTVIKRETRETTIRVAIDSANLEIGCQTSVPFLDHMLAHARAVRRARPQHPGARRSRASHHRGRRHLLRRSDRPPHAGDVRALRRSHDSHGRRARPVRARPRRTPVLRGPAPSDAVRSLDAHLRARGEATLHVRVLRGHRPSSRRRGGVQGARPRTARRAASRRMPSSARRAR